MSDHNSNNNNPPNNNSNNSNGDDEFFLQSPSGKKPKRPAKAKKPESKDKKNAKDKVSPSGKPLANHVPNPAPAEEQKGKKQSKNSHIKTEEAYLHISALDYINNIANINLIIKDQIDILRTKSINGEFDTKDIKTLISLQRCIVENNVLLSTSENAYSFARQELKTAIAEYRQELAVFDDMFGEVFGNFIQWLDDREMKKRPK